MFSVPVPTSSRTLDRTGEEENRTIVSSAIVDLGESTVHPEKIAFFATSLSRPVVLNGVSWIRNVAESNQLMILVGMMVLSAPDMRFLARPIEIDP